MTTFTVEKYNEFRQLLEINKELIKTYITTPTISRDKKYPEITKIQELFKELNNDWKIQILKYILEIFNTYNTLILNYESPHKTCIYVCKKNHEYKQSRTGMNKRIKDKKGICGICNNNGYEKNNYILSRKQIVINKINEILKKNNYPNIDTYDTKSKNIKIICSKCKELKEFTIAYIYKESILICYECRRKICHNKDDNITKIPLKDEEKIIEDVLVEKEQNEEYEDEIKEKHILKDSIDNILDMTDIIVTNKIINEKKSDKEKFNIQIDKYFKNDTILITREEWMILIEKSKNIEFKKELIQKLTDKSLLLPFPKVIISEDKLKEQYNRIVNSNVSIEMFNNIKTITSNTNGIVFLNNFVLESILSVRKKRTKTIYEAWKIKKEVESIWNRLLTKEDYCNSYIDAMKLIRVYGYKVSRAYNFPPNIAKCMYNTYKAKRVLDFSSGFGGRLFGFWCSEAKEYIGIDPNKKIDYLGIMKYMKEHDNRDKKVKIIQLPAEDVDFKTLGKFDFIFTSPPYFNLEVYSEDETQSSNRYKEYKEWKDNFLFNVLKKCISVLTKGGRLCINIKNMNKYKIAEDMVDYLNKNKEIEKEDIIYIKQQKKSKEKDKSIFEKENIYIFIKNN